MSLIMVTMQELFVDWTLAMPTYTCTQYEGLNLANQINRKLGVFDLKFEGSHSTFR